MSITRLYDRSVNTERLAAVGASNKTAYQAHLSGVSCRIDQVAGDSSFLGEGAIYKHFKMYCEEAKDIQETDRIVDGSVKYTVRAVKNLSFKQRSYKEVILELAQ